MTDMSRQLKAYVALVVTLGAICLILLTVETVRDDLLINAISDTWWWIIVWLAILCAAESVPPKILQIGAALSVDSAILVASTLLFGPGVVAWFGVFSAIVFDGLIRKAPLYKTVFNAAQLVLCFGIAGKFYHLLAGDYLIISKGMPSIEMVLLGLFSLVITYFLINSVSVSIAVGLQERLSPIRVWKAHFRWTLFSTIALVTPMGFFMALVCIALGNNDQKVLAPFSAFFFFLPILFVQYSMKLYLDLKEEQLSAIAALCSAQDASDKYTFGHSERVSKVSESLATHLKLSDKEVETIKHAGQLHDIGKIGIDYKVVQKPGPLNLKEWSEIKKHPAIGAQILRNLRFLKDATPYVELHHERLDGGGYPLGKKADEIPLGARIIKVADAFDAMTSARPYRPAMTISQALEQLFKDSGDQYDKDVVAALSELIKRGEIDIEKRAEKQDMEHV